MKTDDCGTLQRRGGWAEDATLGRCTFPIGPRNTWSNLAYPLVGWGLVVWHPTVAGVAFAVAMTVLGLGSGLYHGFKTSWSNRLDWAGMYMVFGSLTVHAIAPQAVAAPWLMLVFGGGVAAYFSYALNGVDVNGQMGAFLFLSLLPAFVRTPTHVVLAVGAFAFFLVAYGLWLLDGAKSRVVGVIWGHALWHVLTAVAIGMTYWSQGGIR